MLDVPATTSIEPRSDDRGAYKSVSSCDFSSQVDRDESAGPENSEISAVFRHRHI